MFFATFRYCEGCINQQNVRHYTMLLTVLILFCILRVVNVYHVRTFVFSLIRPLYHSGRIWVGHDLIQVNMYVYMYYVDTRRGVLLVKEYIGKMYIFTHKSQQRIERHIHCFMNICRKISIHTLRHKSELSLITSCYVNYSEIDFRHSTPYTLGLKQVMD